MSGLPSRATGLVRRDGSGAAATPRTAGGDGLIDRARDNPRYAIAIAGGGLLLIAWIAWAIYVTTDHGARAGLGVLLSWPVLLGALILVSLPFIGLYLLIRRLNDGRSSTAEGDEFEPDAMDSEDEASDEDEDAEDEEDDDSEDAEDEEDEDEDEADAEESKAASK